jgi:DDE family transposase
MGLDPYIAVERQKHHDEASESEPTAAAAEVGVKEAMRQKLATSTGKVLYAARKRIVEPVFGQTKGARGIRGFLLRGLEEVAAEWQLICLTHNLLKVWRRACGAGASAGG